jgi:hypothetical protein
MLCRVPLRHLFQRQRDRARAADETGKIRIQHDIPEPPPMRRRDELDTASRNCAHDARVVFEANLVHDDHLGAMVHNRLKNDLSLRAACRRAAGIRQWDLQAPRASDCGMGRLSISTDLVTRIGNHNAPVEFIGKDRRRAAEQGRLPGARRADHQDVLAARQEICDRARGSFDGPSGTERKPDDLMITIANARDTMQGPIDAGSVILPKPGDPAEHVLKVAPAHLL